jgi:outer membrane protein assembly factor BamB
MTMERDIMMNRMLSNLLLVSALSAPARADVSAQQQVLWEQSVGHRFDRLQVAGGSPVAVGEEGAICFDPATGRQLWRAERGGAREMLVFDVPGFRQAALLYRSARGVSSSGEPEGASWAVYLYDCATGQGLWRTTPAEGDACLVLPRPEVDRLLVAVRAADGRGTLFALALKDGRPVWQVPLGPLPARPYGTNPDPRTLLVALGERLILLDRGERPPAAKAVAAGTGDLLWLAFLEGETGESEDLRLGVYADRLYALGRRFHRLNDRDGTVLWTRPEPWEAVGFRGDLLLLRRGDGERLQAYNAEGGQPGWSREQRLVAGAGLAVVWTSTGVLIGESGGRSTLIDPARGRVLRAGNPRYRPNPGRELEWALPAGEGLVFIQAAEDATRLWGTRAEGTDRWTLELGVLPGIGRGPVDYGDHPLVVTGGSPGELPVLWLVAGGPQGPVFTGVDLAAGRVAVQLPIGATNPLFAVDPAAGRLFYIDPRRVLVGAAY